MLKKIEDRQIMTGKEAAEKYNNCRFLFIITKQVGYDYINSKGYVAYTYDKYSECLQIPEEEKRQGVACANTFGVNYDAYSYPSVERIVYGDF